MGRIVGIVSIKGGVGKTSCAANLGASLAKEFGKKVLLVDANFTAPNLGLHFGIVNPKYTIHDVLMDKIDITEAILDHQGEFHIIPASLVDKKINPFKLKHKLNRLRDNYDMIIIDSSPNLNEEMLSTMIASDELLVVTSPDYPTLSTTMRAVKLAQQKKLNISGLIVNKVRGKDFELSLKEIEEATGVPVLGVLPDDIRVQESIANTTDFTSRHPTTNVSVEMKKLAATMIGQEYQDPRFWSKVKSKFNKEVPKHELNRALFRQQLNKE